MFSSRDFIILQSHFQSMLHFKLVLHVFCELEGQGSGFFPHELKVAVAKALTNYGSWTNLVSNIWYGS